MKLPERSRLPDNLEIPGLYPRRRRQFPRWPVWLWLVVLAVAAIPVVGVPGVVLAHYTTSNSGFCLNCHGTGETPDRSVPSDVHPSFDQVSCVDCHAKPGQIVFEGYVKGFMAEPERVASNCVRCHAGMTERTDTQGFKFNVRGIAIDHKAHLDRGATCVSCHSNVAHDLEVPKTNRPRMESCYACHSRTTSCTTCHTGGIPPAPTSRETVGRRPVAPPKPAADASQPAASAEGSIEQGKAIFTKQCATCHGADGGAIPSADLRSKDFLEERGAAGLAKSTAEGKGGMPAFGAAKGGPLQDDQVRAVVQFLLSAAGVTLAREPEAATASASTSTVAPAQSTAPTAPQAAPESAAPTATRAPTATPMAPKATATPRAALADAVSTDEGKSLFSKLCAGCHGQDGSSLSMANLKSRTFLESVGRDGLLKVTSSGKGGMPPFGVAAGGPLADAQVQAIVEYLLTAAN